LGVHHFVIVSDFNASNLAALLSRVGSPRIQATCAPFGQPMQCLLDASHVAIPSEVNAAIVWTMPQGVSQAYRKRLDCDGGKLEDIETEAGDFARAIMGLPARIRHIFVPTWSAPHPFHIRRGLLDMNLETGLSLALMKMNLILHETTRSDPRIHLFDAHRWTALSGEKAYDPRLWYASKTPYSLTVFKHAAVDFAGALRGLQGGARKLLIVDLDGTLWGGVLGDDGWRNLRLGGHDPVGEAYRDFQAALRALARRGILLAVASKNDEHIALEALESHPEMLLRTRHFAGWRINWNDKCANIVELADELNIGLDAAVFIDDNPIERDRIRKALPAVLVPEWPANPVQYCNALMGLDCFDAPIVSAEDRDRTAMYAAERERTQARHQAPSLDDWLQSLELTMEVDRLSPANLPRAVQLLNKTNQFNLSTRRLSASEFLQWAGEEDHCVLVFKVADKFGDYGLVGIWSLVLDQSERTARLIDYLLSCRVFGRKVEEGMFRVLEMVARRSGASRLAANYQPTEKNRPCLAILEALELERPEGGLEFTSNLEIERPFPRCVRIKWNQSVNSYYERDSGENAVTDYSRRVDVV
jgi:FkbH-like protein